MPSAEHVKEARRLKHAKEGQQGKVAYLTDDGYQWREKKKGADSAALKFVV